MSYYAIACAATFRLLGVPREAVVSISILYLNVPSVPSIYSVPLIQSLAVVILVLPQMVNALSLDPVQPTTL